VSRAAASPISVLLSDSAIEKKFLDTNTEVVPSFVPDDAEPE
jgi:hypothetical protein